MSKINSDGITVIVFDPSTGRITQSPARRSRYAVETRFFGDHWENCWTDEAGNPLTFTTRREAQSEIDEAVEATALATAAGDMLGAYFPDDFRIVKVRHG